MSWLQAVTLASLAALPLVLALFQRDAGILGEAWVFAASGVSLVAVAAIVRTADRLALGAVAGISCLLVLGFWYEIAVTWAWLPDAAVTEASRWLALGAGVRRQVSLVPQVGA